MSTSATGSHDILQSEGFPTNGVKVWEVDQLVIWDVAGTGRTRSSDLFPELVLDILMPDEQINENRKRIRRRIQSCNYEGAATTST